MKADIYFRLFLLLVAIAFIFLSFQVSTSTGFTAFQTRAGLLPLIIGSVMAVSCVAGLFADLRKKATEESPATRGGRQRRAGVSGKLEAFTAAWGVAAILLLFLFGFLVGSFIFMSAYFKTHNNGWFKSIVISLGTAMFIFLVFVFALNINLYPGVLLVPLYRSLGIVVIGG